MTLQELRDKIQRVIQQTHPDVADGIQFEVEFAADPKFGDIVTNAAMVLTRAKALQGRAPREIAEELLPALRAELPEAERIEIAGPGFINITLKSAALAALAQTALRVSQRYAGRVVVTEYSDPNPFKVLHVGHLYTSVVGDAITNLLKLAGAQVHAVNFGGDVGLHVAKTMWAILHQLGGDSPEKLQDIPADQRADWMAAAYVEGTGVYEAALEAGADPQSKLDIMLLNRIVYWTWEADKHEDESLAFPSITGNKETLLNVGKIQQIYLECRQWSYDYFDAFYARIGTHFEKYYPESAVAPLGLKTVLQQLKRGVYKKSDGAVVFEGEPYGLHTRVFVTSPVRGAHEGLPTYEAKDVGLIMSKWKDFKEFDLSVVITGNDITEYMKVVLKSVEQFEPELVRRSRHITHGNVKLAGGVKMSSRKGNFLRAIDVLDLVTEANTQTNANSDTRIVLGAVKYAFLKQRIGADLIFVPEESVSLDGNSGPYLQYAHARARSILAKSERVGGGKAALEDLDAAERWLALAISRYPQVIERAVDELMPHYVATYLYELAQIFNRFYEGNRVIGDARQEVRLVLVELYAGVLKNGLGILGIEAPDRL